MRKTHLEILPFIHDPRSVFHNDMIHYLESLPTGSTIFIELTQQDIDSLFLAFGNRGWFGLKKDRDILDGFKEDPIGFATMDVLLCSIIKRLKLIPIRSEWSNRLDENNSKHLEQMERDFCNRITSYFNSRKLEFDAYFFVVVGASHVGMLASLLSRNNFSVRISRDFTISAEKLKQIMSMCAKLRDERITEESLSSAIVNSFDADSFLETLRRIEKNIIKVGNTFKTKSLIRLIRRGVKQNEQLTRFEKGMLKAREKKESIMREKSLRARKPK